MTIATTSLIVTVTTRPLAQSTVKMKSTILPPSLLASQNLPLVHQLYSHHLFSLFLSEINIKQQLVDQLEKTQKSLQSLRSQYEEKMLLLQTQIKTMESERDKIMKDMSEY